MQGIRPDQIFYICRHLYNHKQTIWIKTNSNYGLSKPWRLRANPVKGISKISSYLFGIRKPVNKINQGITAWDFNISAASFDNS